MGEGVEDGFDLLMTCTNSFSTIGCMTMEQSDTGG